MLVKFIFAQPWWIFFLALWALGSTSTTWSLWRKLQQIGRQRDLQDQAREQELQELKQKSELSDSEVASLRQQNSELEQYRLQFVQTETMLQAKADLVQQRDADNASLKAELNRIRDDLIQSEKAVASLRTRNEEVQKFAEETKERGALNKDQMLTSFESLAQKVFEEKTATLKDQNQTSLQALLTPLSVRLEDFTKRIDETQLDQTKERVSLKEELKNLRDLNQQLSQDAKNLVTALKGNQKDSGNWGEVILEKILESSRFNEGPRVLHSDELHH